MSRWMTDNYTLRGFWRGWHCSFNRWLIRYIYVPLGVLILHTQYLSESFQPTAKYMMLS